MYTYCNRVLHFRHHSLFLSSFWKTKSFRYCSDYMRMHKLFSTTIFNNFVLWTSNSYLVQIRKPIFSKTEISFNNRSGSFVSYIEWHFGISNVCVVAELASSWYDKWSHLISQTLENVDIRHRTQCTVYFDATLEHRWHYSEWPLLCLSTNWCSLTDVELLGSQFRIQTALKMDICLR